MSVDDVRHDLFVHESAVSANYVHPTDEAKVATYGEHLSIVAHIIITESALHNLALVVNCEAEDASKPMCDVRLIVLDEHSCYVGSAGNVVGRE